MVAWRPSPSREVRCTTMLELPTISNAKSQSRLSPASHRRQFWSSRKKAMPNTISNQAISWLSSAKLKTLTLDALATIWSWPPRSLSRMLYDRSLSLSEHSMTGALPTRWTSRSAHKLANWSPTRACLWHRTLNFNSSVRNSCFRSIGSQEAVSTSDSTSSSQNRLLLSQSSSSSILYDWMPKRLVSDQPSLL